MPELQKVAIYCRLSEEDRNKLNHNDDSESIKNQKIMLTQYANNHDWMIYDIYSDDDFTGSDRNRPDFNRLLRDAEAGQFNIVLCKTQSRFTRELEMVEKYIHYLFPLWGIRFVSIVDNADTDIKGNKKSRQINGLVNEWYLEDMSENIKAVLTNRRKNGLFIGAFAPYGYKKDPNRKGHLIVDDEAAQIVRRIFRLYTSGIGCSSIARILNSEGILTPAEYKNQNGLEYKNQHYKSQPMWRYYSINRIISDEVYIGNLVQNKAHSISYKTKIVKPTDKSEWIRVENMHEPIIDLNTWNTVRKLVADRAVHSTSRKNDGSYRDCNVFSRKLICSHCGGLMKMTKTSTGIYYRCGTRFYDKERCSGSFISCKPLYKSVLAEFQNHISQYALVDEISSQIQIKNHYEQDLNAQKSILSRLKKKYSEAMNANKKLYVDKVNGIITDEIYIDMSQSFRSDIEKYGKEIERTQATMSRIESEMSDIKSKVEIAKEYLDCKELTFAMVQMFVEKIIVHPSVPYKREINIEIFWNF
ncbi:MAG: recombinase family protein [Bacteroides sp.]|nr:recombinase family protein [Eubacterium sp.]MCM1417662.1 recombinase family protein [Roseburia sp.]MCM1461873.1 recombinase family protein [Bacteroides sp.]